MPLSPVEAEATGQHHIPLTYRGVEFLIPVDADEWPLTAVAATLGATPDGDVRVNHMALSQALEALLGSRWAAFLGTEPKRRHLVDVSHRFAEAIGFPGSAEVDVAFGALPRRLFTLERWPDACEATLSEHGLRYSDRWRFDDAGARRLTLREIHVRLTYARYDSPFSIARNGGKLPLSDSALVGMDVYELLGKTRHPARPLPPGEAAARDAKQSKKTDAVADYKRRHTPSLLDTARANSPAGRKKVAHAENP